MGKQKKPRSIGVFCVLLILVLVILYSGLQILESTVFNKAPETDGETTSKTITKDGVQYFPRQDITVMMVLGIDNTGPVKSSNFYRNDGSADSIMLLILDNNVEECTVLYLNRDTMLEMDALGVNGEYAGVAYGQLALAHTYGSGLEDSCENVKNTLMKFIHGLTVDYYVAMNMDAVTILNDAVGGVTVNVVEDFSEVDESIPMGEVTLMGDQVLNYIRTRKNVGDQKNATRMERHTEYVANFLERLREKEAENTDFLLNIYEEVAPYIVTDCTVNTLSNLLQQYSEYQITEIVIPEGDNYINNDHYEFHIDEDKFEDLVIELFYAPK